MPDSEDVSSNPTDNRPFPDVLDVAVSRRKVMIGSFAAAATTAFVAPAVVGAIGDDADESDDPSISERRRRRLLRFEPLANEGGPNPSISSDYEYQVLIPWGLPLFAGVPELDPTDVTSNGSANQEQQVGLGHDGMWFFPDDRDRARDDDDDDRDDDDRDDDDDDDDDDDVDERSHRWGRRPSNNRGVLCINHEFGTNFHCLRKGAPESLEDVRVSQAVHGVSVIELAKRNGQWEAIVPGRRNRRITPNTPMRFTGPAKDSDLLKTPAGNGPAGTVNNCANGKTPWGTYLTCEENFNGYFGRRDGRTDAAAYTAEQQRYGFDVDGFGYGWYLFDDRWDLGNPDYTNEENRFGWIVEIDPQDPHSTPSKRTALGRVKHENAELVIGRGGRAVVYMGDDQRFDYIYKFVSAGNYRRMLAQGKSPLDEGTLYVARFNDDFTGDWLELSPNNPLLADKSMDWILVYTRLAADILGATPMDRPEWITLGQRQYVYGTLTNNSRRTVPDTANPEAPNNDGHIIRWRDTRRHTGTRFRWDIFLLASQTRPENGGDPNGTFTDPDGLWADPDGRLFIETDGGQPFGNNQLVVADSRTKELRRLFAGVAGDEITGLTVTPNRRTMFVNSQHPGNGDPARTNFPVAGAGGPEVPRDAMYAITRKNRGRVGS